MLPEARLRALPGDSHPEHDELACEMHYASPASHRVAFLNPGGVTQVMLLCVGCTEDAIKYAFGYVRTRPL